MALEVLRSRQQIADSRLELRRRGLSCATPEWKAFLHRHGMLQGIRIGDELKSWDVLRTVDFIASRLPRDAPVLDIGAHASELPCILHRLGFTQVSGIDLNPQVLRMPQAGAVSYRVGDFLHTKYADGSFAAITAISVIEHGFDGAALFAEMGRLLRPRGYFIASFDYWPEKIRTDEVSLFDMSWTIFSRREVEELTTLARAHGLRPSGHCMFDAADAPIRYMDRDYTFAWLVLERT